MPLFNLQRSGFGTLAAGLAVALLLVIGATRGSAQVQSTKIGVQFLDPQDALGNQPVNGSTVGAPGFTQSVWNGVSVEDSTNTTFTTWSRSGLPLKDDSGATSPVTLSYFCQGSMLTQAIVAGQSAVTNQEKLVSNAIMTFNDTAFVKFSNVPSGGYVLVVYTANRHGDGSNGYVGQFGSYSVNGGLPVTLGNQYGKDFTTNGDTYKSHAGYPLTTGNVGDPNNAGNYYVFSDLAPDSANEITLTFNAPSNDAAVNAVQLIKIIPVFTTQPRAGTVTTVGSDVTLSVVSPTATAFQWKKSTDGGATFTNVSGATSAMLTLTNAQTSDGGIYRVVATTPDGSYTSSNAVLTVFTSNPNDPPVFVAFRTSQVASGTTPASATTSTINAPGSGWSYSAAAQTAGTTWNQILQPNPRIGSSTDNGSTGTFVCNSANNIGLTSATDAGTTVKLKMNVVVGALDSGTPGRTEPSAGTGATGTLAPSGLMDQAWRIYGGSNYSTATISGLTANAHYLLYVYSSLNLNPARGGKFTLNPDNVGSDDVATKSTTGSTTGNLFSTDGSTYGLTPVGGTWQQFHAVTNSSGNIVITSGFTAANHQYYNGLQLVPYPLPVITAQPPASVQGSIGRSASITVSVTNGAGASGSLNYQWQKAIDSGSTFQNIAPSVNASAVTPTLSFSNIQKSDEGLYRVLVTNSISGGTVISTTTTLIIDPERAFVESYGLDPETNGAPEADPDGDGIANRLEFFLGGDPTVADTGILPVSDYKSAADGGPALVFEFNRDKEAADMSYTVEYTTDLTGSWTTAVNGVGGITIVTTAIDANTDHITVTIPSASSKLFARLRL